MKPARILVVEDETLVALDIKECITGFGYEVCDTVTSGEEAVNKAGDLRPVHTVVASSAFFGILNTLCRTYDPDGELTLDDMIGESVDLLLDGWRAR